MSDTAAVLPDTGSPPPVQPQGESPGQVVSSSREKRAARVAAAEAKLKAKPAAQPEPEKKPEPQPGEIVEVAAQEQPAAEPPAEEQSDDDKAKSQTEREKRISKAWADISRERRKVKARESAARDLMTRAERHAEEVERVARLAHHDPERFVREVLKLSPRELAMRIAKDPETEEQRRSREREERLAELERREKEREERSREEAKQRDLERRFAGELNSVKAELEANAGDFPYLSQYAAEDVAQQLARARLLDQRAARLDIYDLLEQAEEQVKAQAERFAKRPPETGSPARSGENTKTEAPGSPRSTVTAADSSTRATPPKQLSKAERIALAEKRLLSRG